MTGSSYNIDVYRGAWTSYVVAAGELDLCSAAQLEAALERAVDRPCHTVIFNGAGITLLTTAAVEILVTAASRCRAEDVNFEAILTERGWKLVELLGMTSAAVPPADAPAHGRDYEIPRQVAEALRDVMDEGELRSAFFGDPREEGLRGYDEVTIP